MTTPTIATRTVKEGLLNPNILLGTSKVMSNGTPTAEADTVTMAPAKKQNSSPLTKL